MDSSSVYRVCPLFNNHTEGERYESIIVNLRVTAAVFSFTGCLFVLFLIWLFKKYKFFTQRLILYTSIAALISSISYILGRVAYYPFNENTERFCNFSGFLLLYSDWTVLLATLSITVNLLLQVASRIHTERLELVYVVAIFVFPLLIVWIPFVEDDFGPAGAWCWIQSQNYDCSLLKSGRVLQFTLWYFPLYSVISVLFLIYLFILYRVKHQVGKWYGTYNPHVHRQKQLLKDEIKPLLWYPVIYCCVQLFPFINRIVISATQNTYFSLYLLHVLTSPLTGALIALAYALDRETLQRLSWRGIKVNMFYRRTDQMVRPYAVKQSHEDEPAQHLLIRETAIASGDDDE